VLVDLKTATRKYTDLQLELSLKLSVQLRCRPQTVNTG
jgi:hypothetical protein